MTNWLAKTMAGPEPSTAFLSRRCDDLEKRLKRLEQKIDGLATYRTMADASNGYDWGNGRPDPYYHKNQDVAGAVQPWVSTTSRIAANLTSSDTVRRTFGEGMLLATSFTILGGLVAWWQVLPWSVAPVVGVAGFALATSVLTILNRTELHRLVSGQNDRNKKRRQTLEVFVTKEDGQGHLSFEILEQDSDVEPHQLVTFARAALEGESLAVHGWIGEGNLFKRGQFDTLMKRLERTGHVVNKRGNVGRQLTAKGKALFKGIAETG